MNQIYKCKSGPSSLKNGGFLFSVVQFTKAHLKVKFNQTFRHNEYLKNH